MSGKDEIYGTTIDQTTEIEIPTSVNDEAIEDDSYAFGDLPGKRRLTLNWNRLKCREILRQLLGMTYNCTDGMVLAETLDTLRSVREHMKQGITSDDGLSLRDSPLKQARNKPRKTLEIYVFEATEESVIHIQIVLEKKPAFLGKHTRGKKVLSNFLIYQKTAQENVKIY